MVVRPSCARPWFPGCCPGDHRVKAAVGAPGADGMAAITLPAVVSPGVFVCYVCPLSIGTVYCETRFAAWMLRFSRDLSVRYCAVVCRCSSAARAPDSLERNKAGRLTRSAACPAIRGVALATAGHDMTSGDYPQ